MASYFTRFSVSSNVRATFWPKCSCLNTYLSLSHDYLPDKFFQKSVNYREIKTHSIVDLTLRAVSNYNDLRNGGSMKREKNYEPKNVTHTFFYYDTLATYS